MPLQSLLSSHLQALTGILFEGSLQRLLLRFRMCTQGQSKYYWKATRVEVLMEKTTWCPLYQSQPYNCAVPLIRPKYEGYPRYVKEL